MVDVPEGGVVLRPPAPADVVGDVGAATREALRFPLSHPAVSHVVAGMSSAAEVAANLRAFHTS